MIRDKCSVCKEKSELHQLTGLTDGNLCCQKCYWDICDELRQGQFTTEQGQQTYKFLREYDWLVTTMCASIKEQARIKGESPTNYAKKVMKLEGTASEILFLKARKTITRQEHYKLMKEALSEAGEVINKGGLSEIYALYRLV